MGSILLGHDRVLELLRRTAEEGKPSHAYLFSGPEGIGKKSAAIEFACLLNCPDGGGHDDACRVCRRIREGIHPDVMVERPERSSIRVDRIRRIQEYFQFPPIEAPFKIIILDDAHVMNRQAQNALLKTLEEPPPGRMLVLVTAKPALLQATVVSRCRPVRFSPLETELMIPLLEQKLRLNPHEARILARMSGGGIGRALRLSSADFPELRAKVTNLLAEPGSVGIRGALELSAWLAEHKDRAAQALGIAESWLRDLLTAKLDEPQLGFVNEDMLDGIRNAAHDIDEHEILSLSDAVTRAGELLDLETNINRNLILDNLILTLIRRRPPSGGAVAAIG
jgi:DNA polymerase-3 subunit delta'